MGSFIAKFDHKLISSQRDVFIASNDKHQRIIDARSADRLYDGSWSEWGMD